MIFKKNFNQDWIIQPWVVHRLLNLDGDFKVIIPSFLNIKKKTNWDLENFRKLTKENEKKSFTRRQDYKLTVTFFSFVILTPSPSFSHMLMSPSFCFLLSLTFSLCWILVDLLIFVTFSLFSQYKELLPCAQQRFVGRSCSADQAVEASCLTELIFYRRCAWSSWLPRRVSSPCRDSIALHGDTSDLTWL